MLKEAGEQIVWNGQFFRNTLAYDCKRHDLALTAQVDGNSVLDSGVSSPIFWGAGDPPKVSLALSPYFFLC